MTDRVKTIEPYVPPVPDKRWIQTRTGERFELLDPSPLTIKLEDIAAGLAKLCRYTGQSNRFYSVAEHCYRVSLLVPEEHAFQALLHDASEAYLGDVSSPLKALLNDYRVIEEQVQAAIYRRFRLPEETAREVKAADYRIRATEVRLLYDGVLDSWKPWLTGHKPVADMTPDAVGWTWQSAELLFLDRARYLWTQHKKSLPPVPTGHVDQTQQLTYLTDQQHVHHVSHGI